MARLASSRALLPLALLLLLAPLVRALTVMDEGKAAHTGATDCGRHRGAIEVRTGAHLIVGENDKAELVQLPDAISIAFVASEGDALECSWIQFVWSEVVATVETPNGRVEGRVPGTVPTSGGEVELTVDPAAPKWTVDSAGTSPAYESRGISFKDSRGDRIFDDPQSLAELLGPQLTVAAPSRLLKLEDTKHFAALLICGGRVCYSVTWTHRCTWAPASGAGPPVTTERYDPPPTGQAGGSVLPAQRAALDREHPGQTLLPP